MTDNINTPAPAKADVLQYKTILLKIGIVGLIYLINKYVVSYVLVAVIRALGLPDMLDEAGFYALTWIFNDTSVYLFPALAMFFLFRSELREKPQLCGYGYKWYEPLLIYPASVFVGTLGSYLTSYINSLFSSNELADPFSSVSPTSSFQFWIFFLSSCVFSPVFEELIFRHILLKPFRKYGDLFAIVISSLFFAITHGNFYQFAYVIIGGFFYAMLTVRSGSLLPAIVVHIINNTIVTVGSYAENATLRTIASVTSVFLMFSGVAALATLIFMRRFRFSPNEYDVPKSEKLRIFVTFPAGIIGILLAMTIFL